MLTENYSILPGNLKCIQRVANGRLTWSRGHFAIRPSRLCRKGNFKSGYFQGLESP